MLGSISFQGINVMSKKLNALSLAIAIGVSEGLGMMLFAWAGWLWGYGTPVIQQIASMFIGYAPSFGGGILGALWGFADGFTFGIVVGWISQPLLTLWQ